MTSDKFVLNGNARLPSVDQGVLLNLNTKNISPYWIDPTQDLVMPVNPLHFEAHKLQLLLKRLDMLLDNNRTAQFSMTNYLLVLEKFTSICKQINKEGSGGGADGDNNKSGTMDEDGIIDAAQAVGEGNASSLGATISSDNPFAR